MLENQFAEVAGLIKSAQLRALKAVNTELIDLYWNVGAYINTRIESAEWGQSIVADLARYLQDNEPGLKGFSDKNLLEDAPVLSRV